MKSVQKIVVKVGTSTLTGGGTKLSKRVMLDLAGQIAKLHAEGKEVVLVSSGAVAAGKEAMQVAKTDRMVPSKQMFASIGQVKLMHTWSELFSLFDLHVGQLLLNRDDFSHRKRYLNVRDTLLSLLAHRAVPIINENDTVATKDIRVGDNDNLAALVANLIAADLLILLTDQEGLYTADPRKNKEATLISQVKHIDDSIFALAGGSVTTLGTGGMVTKIEAAHIAAQSGTKTIIASSERPNVLAEIVSGKSLGTTFLSEISARESRKRWLLSEKKQGTISVDAGAASKIREGGASLLPSGIVKTTHDYERGASVHVVGPSGEPIAVGIANYGSKEIEKLLGKQSAHIEDVLGFSYGPEIIHRSNMTRIAKEDGAMT